MSPIYTATVTSQGGRTGHISSEDGILNMRMNIPKEFGDVGGAANPELLFAGSYAACFESALQLIANRNKKPVKLSKVVADVTIGMSEAGGLNLSVKLKVHLPNYGKADGEKLMQEAHKVCPYSNAVRGNINVQLELVEY